MGDAAKTSIVILTYNNLEYNRNCLESIRKYTEPGTYEIIVVDNCSTDGTREWLGTQENIKLLLNDFNAGFPKGCNMGIALAEKENDILLLNNDTVVTVNWLKNLRTCLYSNEKIGAVGAVCNHNENLQWENLPYTTLEEMQEQAEKNNISDNGRWEEKLFLIGFCILIKRPVLNGIGTLDEEYTPGYVEDNDFSLRIVTAGYKLMLCHDCFIHHYLGTEFRKDLSRFYPVLNKNRALFTSKWGFSAFAFDEIKFASLRVYDAPSKTEPVRILELGCGIGTTLLKIKEKAPHAELYGIEPDEHMAAIAKRVATVSTKAIGSFPLEFPEEYFDTIFVGNYLEQVENPTEFLCKLRKHLKKDGTVIAEIQNLMHYSVIRELLKGVWQNASASTLNRTNRTFFTLDDIHRLFSGSGYQNPYVLHWYSVPTQEEEAWIQELGKVGGEQRLYLYKTYLFSVKFQK